MEHHYKAHSILISAWARLDPDGFTAELRISKKAHVILQTFKINQLAGEVENFLRTCLQNQPFGVRSGGAPTSPLNSLRTSYSKQRISLWPVASARSNLNENSPAGWTQFNSS